MAKIEAPIKIDGFKCVEDITQAVLNYTYKGKTLKEWADSISEPKNNADCIRAMSDEELAKLFDSWIQDCDCNDIPCHKSCEENSGSGCINHWLDWLKEEAKDER